MTKYRCDICGSEVIESASTPDFCSNCGTTNGTWINLDTMCKESRKTITKPLSVRSLLGSRPSPIKKKKSATLASSGPVPSGKAPVYFSSGSPSSSTSFTSITTTPSHSPVPTPYSVFSNKFFYYFFEFISKIYENVKGWKKFPYILSIAMIILTLGKIFSHPFLLGLVSISLLVVIPYIFFFFHLNVDGLTPMANVFLVPFFLLIISLPTTYFIRHIGPDKSPFGILDKDVNSTKLIYCKKSLNLYESPKPNSTALCSVLPLDSLKTTGKSENGWIQVRNSFKTGWIIDDKSTYFSSISDIKLHLIPGMNQVNMRVAPSTNHHVIRSISQNENLIFILISSDKKWVKVRESSGRTGWIWRAYIKPL